LQRHTSRGFRVTGSVLVMKAPPPSHDGGAQSSTNTALRAQHLTRRKGAKQPSANQSLCAFAVRGSVGPSICWHFRVIGLYPEYERLLVGTDFTKTASCRLEFWQWQTQMIPSQQLQISFTSIDQSYSRAQESLQLHRAIFHLPENSNGKLFTHSAHTVENYPRQAPRLVTSGFAI
jgi:hypothetical protein